MVKSFKFSSLRFIHGLWYDLQVIDQIAVCPSFLISCTVTIGHIRNKLPRYIEYLSAEETMARLSLFGVYQLECDPLSPVRLDSDKTRGLLAYLTLVRRHPHTRQYLAALFWPDSQTPRANLSQALHVLRKALEPSATGEPLFLADTHYVQLNPDFALTVDVHEFQRDLAGCANHRPARQATCLHCVEQSSQAVELARGEFLADLVLDHCEEVEAWIFAQRAALNSQLTAARLWLAEVFAQHGQALRGLELAHAVISEEPLNEHGQLLYLGLLVATGQQAVARLQAERLQHELAQEGLPPSTPLARLIKHCQQETISSKTETTVQLGAMPLLSFVGRRLEFEQLHVRLRRALAGTGQIALVTGEAGAGKSVLLHHFAKVMQSVEPQLLVVTGNCNAYTGIGDPYLPFRELLTLLIGEVEPQLRAQAIDPVHATRLQQFAGQTLKLLTTIGSDLIGSLISTDTLIARLAVLNPEPAAWVTRLRTLMEQSERNHTNTPMRPQVALFEQFTALLHAIAAQRPLLLLLDDLQWADLGTIHLLFHLAHKLTGARILLVGAYRPADVAAGRNGQRHPLEPVLYEVQRLYGEVEVALDAADGRCLVEALLDREANQLADQFRLRLYRYTQGNALFTIELLRGMQERGDLMRADDGAWIEGPTLEWDSLPPRVEAVIAERIGRLPPELRETLEVASVEGEQFTLEVVAHLLQMERHQVVRWLGSELDRQHQLVQMVGIIQSGEQMITRYRFRHILFQRYLYSRLDTAQRVVMHSAVAEQLEALYAGQAETQTEMAGQLARHYEEARQRLKAAEWLLVQGQRSIRAAALEEARIACEHGVALLEKCQETPTRQKLELQLQITRGVAIATSEGYNVPQAEECFRRAEELCQQVGNAAELFVVLRNQSAYHRLSRDLRLAVPIAERMLRLADNQGHTLMQIEARASLGNALLYMGEFPQAHYYLLAGTKFMPVSSDDSWCHTLGQDSVVACHSILAYVLWLLGYPDQSDQMVQYALNYARKLQHYNSIAQALAFAAPLSVLRNDPITGSKIATELVAVATAGGNLFWIQWHTVYFAWLKTKSNALETGIGMMRSFLPADPRQAEGALLTWLYSIYADALAQVGDTKTGLRGIELVLEYGAHRGEYYWESELYRLRGELFLLQATQSRIPDPAIIAQAEAAFQRAIAVAQQQKAKSWELRAATNLAQLWRRQGKIQAAVELLGPVYNWFTEGFETHDLQKAKMLLDLLKGNRLT